MGKIASDGGPSKYYDFPEGAVTLNDLIEHKDMSFAQGNIFKAAFRLGNKEGISLEYDLNKIIYYANRMLAQLDREVVGTDTVSSVYDTTSVVGFYDADVVSYNAAD